MGIQNWEHFFKPEVRSSGQLLHKQGKISVSTPSDTEISAFIRTTPPLKVSLKTQSVSSPIVYADCNCPAAKKDLFCKHIWATLIATNEKNPDFFEDKIEIEKMKSELKETAFKPKPSAQTKAWEEKQAAFKLKQAAYKEKQKESQATYRKEQYQKQKQRVKDFKNKTKDISENPEFPVKVEKALFYFSENGIDLRNCLNPEMIGVAKKKLARVFHPDLGGSHEEILKLNEYAEVLMDFVKS